MQLQTTSPESKFPNEYSDVIFIQIVQHLKKLLQKYKGVPILWNTVYIHTVWFRLTEFRMFTQYGDNFFRLMASLRVQSENHHVGIVLLL